MAKTNQWLLAIFSIVVLGLIVWMIQTGISNRPLVGYKFEGCPKEIGSQYSNDLQKQDVGLGISNSGNTKASLILHFYGENITILNETKKPYCEKQYSDIYYF
jgi:hypothetical protein